MRWYPRPLGCSKIHVWIYPLFSYLEQQCWALGRGREQTGVKNGVPEPVGVGLGQMGDRQWHPWTGPS